MVSIHSFISHFLKTETFPAAFPAALSPDYKREIFSFVENLENTENQKEEMKTVLLSRNKALII